jgi:hypothetical protein
VRFDWQHLQYLFGRKSQMLLAEEVQIELKGNDTVEERESKHKKHKKEKKHKEDKNKKHKRDKERKHDRDDSAKNFVARNGMEAVTNAFCLTGDHAAHSTAPRADSEPESGEIPIDAAQDENEGAPASVTGTSAEDVILLENMKIDETQGPKR